MREELLKEYAEEALKNGPHRFIRPDDKIFYMDGFKDDYNLGLKSKINKTTISDAPALPGEEIVELKAQIEKMKCCFNCKHSRTEYEHCKTNKHEKWEIKEK